MCPADIVVDDINCIIQQLLAQDVQWGCNGVRLSASAAQGAEEGCRSRETAIASKPEQ
jgi:hypothetical protein